MRWSRTFRYGDVNLEYNRVPYNNCAERAVEVPIAVHFLRQLQPSASLLEVGHVLHSYETSTPGLPRRRIIDKFERDEGVENIDIRALDIVERFDGIVSISTVEHVGQHGFGENGIRDREAPLLAIRRIFELLRPSGRGLVTVPFGRLLDGGWYIQFDAAYFQLLVSAYGVPAEAFRISYLRRLASENTGENPHQIWAPAAAKDLLDVEFGFPFPFANAIAVVELAKAPGMKCRPIRGGPHYLHYQRPIDERVLPCP